MIEIIDQRIKSEFKCLFKRLLDEGKSLPFIAMLERVCSYLEVDCPKKTQQELTSWYQDIAEHFYLKKLVDKGVFQELIFFGSSFITCDGKTQDPIPLEDQDFILAWAQLAFNHHIAWNHANPFVSFAATINDVKTRITLIHPSCSPDGQMRAFIRAHAPNHFHLNDFCNEQQASQLRANIQDKKNILIVGATGSGKTSLMRSMLDLVDENEHVIILEDTHEIKRSAKRTTSLLADASDPKRSLKEYCAMALRMSPERIVLGEVRSKEVVPLLLAFNSGHRGGLTSLHADSVADALERLALLFQLYSDSAHLPHAKVMELVCRNIDQVVLVKDKQVTEIAKVIGCENGRALFESDTVLNQDLDWWKKASGH